MHTKMKKFVADWFIQIITENPDEFQETHYYLTDLKYNIKWWKPSGASFFRPELNGKEDDKGFSTFPMIFDHHRWRAYRAYKKWKIKHTDEFSEVENFIKKIVNE
jgi:hypothetical protein